MRPDIYSISLFHSWNSSGRLTTMLAILAPTQRAWQNWNLAKAMLACQHPCVCRGYETLKQPDTLPETSAEVCRLNTDRHKAAGTQHAVKKLVESMLCRSGALQPHHALEGLE